MPSFLSGLVSDLLEDPARVSADRFFGVWVEEGHEEERHVILPGDATVGTQINYGH